jgi:hypothetical protein
MLKIISGKRYNTATEEKLCELPCDKYGDDFGWHRSDLYVTKNGSFFIAGEGNAYSMWGKAAPGGAIPGEGIRPITADEARQHLENADEDGQIERFFEVTDA